jgi:hypothetical protein
MTLTAPVDPAWSVVLQLSWSLNGGGSLSTGLGVSTVYTAPSSNDGCTNNATITLRCNGFVQSVTNIIVNAMKTDEIAYSIGQGCETAPTDTCTAESYFCCTKLLYNCAGTKVGFSNPSTGGSSCDQLSQYCDYGENYAGAGTKHDMRTADQIALGCCPSELY